jgi:hypothetical protein
MWLPESQIVARPSHPLNPYVALQTRILPFVALHDLGLPVPATMGESRTLDALQSTEAPPSAPSQFEYAVFVTLSASGTVNGFADRAQW